METGLKKLNPIHRTWIPSAWVGGCLLLSPFVVFIRYQNYPVLRPEFATCFALLSVAGILLGIIMELVGQYSRVLVLSCLITLLVDIQMPRPERPLILMVVFGVSLIPTWFLRNQLARFGTFVTGVLLISSFILPSGHVDTGYQTVTSLTPGNPNLPVFLHIILDEHIGVEGIPERFDPDGYYAEQLRDFYLDHGFSVFGRAYSRYFNTWNTIPNLLNFDAPRFRLRYCGSDDGKFYVKANRYFELMKRRGYQIHVYQSDYLNYCSQAAGVAISSCYTYELESIQSIVDSPISLAGKTRILLGVYSRLSEILGVFNIPQVRVSAVSASKALEKLHSDLLEAKPGMMFIAHLMLPHYPYIYRSDCSLRKQPEKWLNAHVEKLKPRHNTESTRAERYPMYLEQISCTNAKLERLFDDLKRLGKYENMIIIIHGDHGSRLVCAPPDAKMIQEPYSESDFVDAFSTLFAVKWPGIPAAYDRRIVPLEALFTSFIFNGKVEAGVEWAGTQHVFFQQGQPQLQVRSMPDFGRELRPLEGGR